MHGVSGYIYHCVPVGGGGLTEGEMDDTGRPDEIAFEGALLRERYQVESRLGRGGMATIYSCTDTELGRKAVVKVPLAGFMKLDGFKERFELEVKGLIDIEHPHVVSIYARGEHHGIPYFISQFLPGGSLEDRIKEESKTSGRMNPKDVLTWLPHVADALDFMHSKGIVHRDVKPGNILFDDHGNVFLSDFGVAKALGTQDTELTAAGMAIGSIEYMPPEQAINENIGPNSDQYALGVTLFECLSGTLPYKADNPVDLLIQKKNAVAPTLQDQHGVPREISDVVARALSIDPEDRFESCAALVAALEVAVWSVDPTPGMRTPPGRAAEVPLKHTLGGSLDFTGLTLLGHYKVGARIGAGGMGSVYLAIDTDLGKNVVIKVPHVRFLAEKGFRDRFEREVKQLLRIEHPSIVRVLARGEHQKVPFYVLQYMKRGSLRERMKKAGKMSVEDVLPWFGATAKALDFLHSRNLIHRDVKPGNILFDEYDHAYLSDFGIAKATEDTKVTQSNTGVGSPRYMAPEQTGENFEGTADQYALAITVFEALTGRMPFEDGTAMEIMLRKMQERPPSLTTVLPGLPQGAADAVSRALSGEADERFPTCRAFYLAFKRALREAPAVAALPEAPVATATRQSAPLVPASVAAPAPAAPQVEHPPRARSPERAPSTPPSVRAQPAALWQPTFILGFVGVWLLARLAPFARFLAPHDPTGGMSFDIWVVLWVFAPSAFIIAVGHGWLFQRRGVTAAWAWVTGTLIGAAVAGVVLLLYGRVAALTWHPLGMVTGALFGASLGVCQWLALGTRLRRAHRWILPTLLGAAAAGALLEFAGGRGAQVDFLLVLASAVLMAAVQLLALRPMTAGRRGGA